MALKDFLAAIDAASAQVAPKYGLTADELRRAMLTVAALEGGLGERAGVGDGGNSHGRFQFNFAGGVGSTLEKQGMSREAIADDVFQANYWTPVIAQHLAAAKAKHGDTPEAVRQAIYAAERPAEIYDSGRFNQAFANAGGRGTVTEGAMTQPSGGGGFGRDYRDPTVDAEYQKRKKRYFDAYQKWIDAGRPAAWKIDGQTGEPAPDPENPVGFEYASALMDLKEFTDSLGTPSRTQGDDPAQQAFENRVKLGDFELRTASEAWRRYTDKLEAAKGNAQNEISDALKRNQQENDPNNPNARWSGGYTYAPLYAKAFERWKSEMGVGEAPGLPNPDYGPLPSPGGQGGASGSTPPGPEMPPGMGTDLDIPNPFPNARSTAPSGADGRYQDPLGQWRDKWGNKWDEKTGRWVNAQGIPVDPKTGQPLVRTDWQNVPRGGYNSGDPDAVFRAGTDPYAPDPTSTSHPSSAPTDMIPEREQRASGGPWTNGEQYPFQNMVIASGQDYPFQNAWHTVKGHGQPDIAGQFMLDQAKKKKAKGGGGSSWWKRIPGFANGVQGFAGGEAMVGERGPEMVQVPGFGDFMVGIDGPEVKTLPQGSNVIPMDQKFLFDRIRQAAAQGSGTDRQRQRMEAQQRAMAPGAEQQAMAAMQRAMAAQLAAKPPMTPYVEPGAPDLWADLRPLTGIPPQMQQQAAQPQKGAM